MKLLKTIALPAIALSMLSLSVMADARSNYANALDSWQSVLETHVDESGRINFAALAANPTELKSYVDAVRVYGPSTDPETFASREATLAFHINTYNALAMYGVIDEGVPKDFNSFFKRASFFRFRRIQIDGKNTNLYDYENKVIRPLNEPRVHFTLNCMVRDCPQLPQSAFQTAQLDEQLEQATREFINSEKYVRVDDEKQQIWVSAIFDFYTKDFVPSGKARDLPDYINHYRNEPLPIGYKVKYLQYDWAVNAKANSDAAAE